MENIRPARPDIPRAHTGTGRLPRQWHPKVIVRNQLMAPRSSLVQVADAVPYPYEPTEGVPFLFIAGLLMTWAGRVIRKEYLHLLQHDLHILRWHGCHVSHYLIAICQTDEPSRLAFRCSPNAPTLMQENNPGFL
jgi:hypothetical protein